MAAEGLLEVVPDELRVLPELLVDAAFDPSCMALMQVAPQVLREETVGGVSDQDVVEVVGLLILEIWPSPADQLAA